MKMIPMPAIASEVSRYALGFGVGYYYGRHVGDRDELDAEMRARFGVSDSSNIHEYEGCDSGYDSGIADCER